MMKSNLPIVLFFISLISTLIIVVLLSIQHVEEFQDWCAEAGGMFIDSRSSSDVCINLEAVILPPEVGE